MTEHEKTSIPISYNGDYHSLSEDEQGLPESKSILSAFTPLQVVFKDINFSVQVEKLNEKGKPTGERFDKKILRGLNGVFGGGRLTGILGASGSGKTSLLNLVAGQLSGLPQKTILDGSIIINGQTLYLNDERLKEISGYVQQDDVILDTMTVREAITMAALLRLPQSMTHQAKMKRVDEVIELLHLEKCSHSVIGSPLMKGISGGERRRVSIAMVMITNPPILYLDEPTSGLDSFTAYSIVKTLKSVAATGRTVAATIHQPSSLILNLFDDLIILSEGNIIYHGPTSEMVGYFAKLGFQCPTYTNPADYLFMEIVNDVTAIESQIDRKEVSGHVQDRLDRLSSAWPKSDESSKYVTAAIASTPSGGLTKVNEISRATFFTQFILLSSRAWRNLIRHKLMVKGRMMQTLILSLLVGLIFLSVTNDQKGIQDRQGSLFFISVNGVMAAAMGVLSIFAAEKAVFMREYANGMYQLPAYFLSRTLVELPFKIVFPVLGTAIMYWMIGYQVSASKFFVMIAATVIVENAGTALGVFIASFFEDIAVALTVLPVFLMPLMMFSGLFTNLDSLASFLSWIQWLSPMKYVFVALAKNEFEGLELYCTEDQLQPVPGYPTPICPITTGSQVIENMSFDSQPSIEVNLLILVAFYLVLSLLAYFALWRQLKKKSRR